MPVLGLCLVFWGVALIIYPTAGALGLAGSGLVGAKAIILESLGFGLDMLGGLLLDETVWSVGAGLLAIYAERLEKRMKGQPCVLSRLFSTRSSVS